MEADILQSILASARNLQTTLIACGAQTRRTPASQPMPDFSIVLPQPLRAPLIKIGVCAATATKLDALYVQHVDEYRVKVSVELHDLWKRLHEEGAYNPVETWTGVAKIAQKKASATLQEIFDIFCNVATEHVKDLRSRKRKSQPVFDQVSSAVRPYQKVLN